LSVTHQILNDSKGGEQARTTHDGSERTAAELRLLSRSRERLELTEVLDLYKSVGRRNIGYFAWIHDVYSWITLPSVSFDRRKVLGEDKTKLAIFDILLQLKQMIIFRSRGRCGRISFPPFPYILDLASSRGFSISIFAKFSLPCCIVI